MALTREQHLLSCLAEECTEIGQRASKALRFGLQEVQPGQPLTNAERIEAEFCDLLAVYEMLTEAGIVRPLLMLLSDGEMPIDRKKQKVEKFMRYAVEQGALEAA